MMKDELVTSNPLHILNSSSAEGAGHRLGLVMARAGLGKTSILVQIALDSLLRDRKVLHVSIGEGLDKARAWYEDVFGCLAADTGPAKHQEFYDQLMRNRMIMTFKESAFNRPRFEERLNDLIYQNIFRPDCVVVDGFDFAAADRQSVEDLHELTEALDIQFWFSALRHRDDERISAAGVPAPCHEVDDLFDTVIVVQPEKEGIRLNIVKDSYGRLASGTTLQLDPSTLMVRHL